MFNACQMDCNKDTKRHEPSLGTSSNKKELSKGKSNLCAFFDAHSVAFENGNFVDLLLC